MGTVIDRIDVVQAGWHTRRSALRLAVAAAKTCLHKAGREPDDVDLLINTGIYRDKNLAEPALAALIQDDIGANPEDPHGDAHGTFSFDVSNGSCGVLTALQIVDGFLRSRTVRCALIVASDANPGRGMSEHFPFSPTGAAMSCGWTDDEYGLGRVHWVNIPDDGENFRATVGLEDGRNVLRFGGAAAMDEHFAAAGARAARNCLREAALGLSDVDIIVAAPGRRTFQTALATELGVPADRITVADDERAHSAALVAALGRAGEQLRPGARVLLVAAAAGVTAGAALYREAPGDR
ncbi:3-oxoacyl-ACP synthase [Mycobacterium intermedium]|uniref:3-oxoacyl-ACP synthase n=1 Tax=Mycobacterium intermedium TaxID=28445 RepID=A0A1E3SFF4_MYCIE|nr:3-oxoacyl-[acyl-carrier-protein] synthase III C-terminal domain-containing protein [Mycobacterium intermedium]MCV6966693.1 3-oxoacyl-ACP synthase [Mycobacterium intermedium]ODR00792.1 3-oxoacyl-ACP synthase [Mycobacterium intermedium]OPE48430.1 3-oxoacyl-ACP synthase [Mycobacterium intermedium]ORB10602.1 3-oxoacyl-ACP synthase [Mycobacterium intermedium]